MNSNKKNAILIPVISVLLGIGLGMIILVASGQSITLLFNAFIKGATGFDVTGKAAQNMRYPGEFLVTAMPLILGGLSIGFAYRCGMFNIGAEGQVLMGGLVATIVAILIPLPPIIGPIIILLIGGLAGALWAFIPGILKSRFNISEVVTGIMLNYTALYGSSYFIKILPGSTQTRTVDFPLSSTLKSSFLADITNNSRLHWGFIVVILAVIIYWFIIEKTTFGFELRATGFNKFGAKYAGIKVNRSIILSLMVSGFLAGLAGSLLVQGTFGYGRVLSAFDNIGFDGIAIALVGSCNAIGVMLAGLLFSLLKVSQPLLQIAKVPREIGDIISASIVFFVAIQWAIQWLIEKISKKKAKGGSK